MGMATVKAIGNQLKELMDINESNNKLKHVKHTWFKNGHYKNGDEWSGYCYVCGCKRERIYNEYIYFLDGKEYDKAPTCHP